MPSVSLQTANCIFHRKSASASGNLGFPNIYYRKQHLRVLLFYLALTKSGLACASGTRLAVSQTKTGPLDHYGIDRPHPWKPEA